MQDVEAVGHTVVYCGGVAWQDDFLTTWAFPIIKHPIWNQNARIPHIRNTKEDPLIEAPAFNEEIP